VSLKTDLSRVNAPQRNSENAPDDWDAAVRSAFLRCCLREGIRAALAVQMLNRAAPSEDTRELREEARDASRKAAVGWLRIETFLARYTDLAALALSRCVEETTLEIRIQSDRSSETLSSSASEPSQAPMARKSQVQRKKSAAEALLIVERARERLERFWAITDFRAA